MNMCGVLVHALPTRCEAVVQALSRLDGVEVHHTLEGGRIVITVEDTDHALSIDTLTSIHNLDGIISATLVYHQFEPADDVADGTLAH